MCAAVSRVQRLSTSRAVLSRPEKGPTYPRPRSTCFGIWQNKAGENSLQGAGLLPRQPRAPVPGGHWFALPWPTPKTLLIKFVAHHLWDLSKRDISGARHVADVAIALKAEGLCAATARTPRHDASLRGVREPASPNDKLITAEKSAASRSVSLPDWARRARRLA